MTSSLYNISKESEIVGSQASFLELQVHDKFKQDNDFISKLNYAGQFNGYLTIHGEGETDGRKKIKFSSVNKTEKKVYYGICKPLFPDFRTFQ